MSERPVLIVDDEEICLTINAAMVKKIGMPVIVARDGLEAVEIIQQQGAAISCVLLDLQLPRMNGIEVLRRIRQIDEGMPVGISSGLLNDAYLEQLEPLKPAGYLDKPVTFEALSAFLHQIMD